MEKTRLDKMVIAYLERRLAELQEKEPHATMAIAAYEDVIYDLVGGISGK